MAKAIQCDRCDGFYVINHIAKHAHIDQYEDDYFRRKFDLCPECAKDFDKFMSGATLESDESGESCKVEQKVDGFK